MRGRALEGLAGAQHHGGEARVVDRVRVVLGLEAEAGVLLVIHAAHARQRAIEMIAAIELHARFGGPHFHLPTGLRFLHARRECHGLAAAVDHEVVIVAFREVHVVRDAFADAARLGEVEARAFHGSEFAGRNERRVRRSVAIGIQHQDVIEDAAGFAEVEVGVVREIDDGGLVGRGGVIDAQLVAVGERVNHRRGQRAGITFLAVRAHVGELDGDFVAGRRQRAGFPDAFVEALGAAVEMVRAVVHREGVFPAVEREPALGDAVGHAAGRRAEERMALHVLIEIVEAADDIAGLAIAVGHPEFREDAAVLGDLGGDALGVRERVDLYFGAVGELSENVLFNLHVFCRCGGLAKGTGAAVEQQRGGEGENGGRQREPAGGGQCFHRLGALDCRGAE